jgi:hypothetical protein
VYGRHYSELTPEQANNLTELLALAIIESEEQDKAFKDIRQRKQ